MIKLDKSITEFVKKNKFSVSYRQDIPTVTKKNEKIAVFVAGIIEDDPDRIGIGYAICNPHDLFDYNPSTLQREPGFGKNIATDRCVKWADKPVIYVPVKIQKQFKQFIERCKKYYKDKEMPAWYGSPFTSADTYENIEEELSKMYYKGDIND